MPRYSYRERDYAFGQAMLKLRTNIGLTQAGLAAHLGVSRRAISEWETGSNYPKSPHLQHVLELCVQQHVFEPGREEEQIRALWKTAHQRVLLDEAWLSALLTRPSAPSMPIEEAGSTAVVRASPAPVQLSPPAETPVAYAGREPLASRRVDWVGALDISHFSGREVEVAELSQWIVQERCRVVTLLGMGGIGKSMLASFLGQHLAPNFEAVLWRSVRDAPPCEDLVADCITFFSETPPAAFPVSLEQRINQLLARLQASRCLLVLDNLETLLASSDPEGNYLPGYEGYERLIGRLAESAHQSCVLITSREKPREIEPLEGARRPVRSLRLVGMDEQTARVLLVDKGLSGTPAAWQRLVAGYAGNPLALKIVAQAVSDLFGGDLDRFLQEGELVFNGVRPLLRQQVARLTLLEQMLLTWLAVVREWTSLASLLSLLVKRPTRGRVLEALEALSRRSLIERGQRASFTLQSVVMEYVTDALLDHLSEEVGSNSRIEDQCLSLLMHCRTEDGNGQGYGPANVIALLKALRSDLRGLDLSRFAIRGAYLQGVEMQDATLAGAVMHESVLSPDEHTLASGSDDGSVKLWDVERGALLWSGWHTQGTMCLAFSPNGRLLASGGVDATVRLWDPTLGSYLQIMVDSDSADTLFYGVESRRAPVGLRHLSAWSAGVGCGRSLPAVGRSCARDLVPARGLEPGWHALGHRLRKPGAGRGQSTLRVGGTQWGACACL